MQVDLYYNLTWQKKVYFQLAHLNHSLEIHAHLIFLVWACFQEVEDVDYHQKCIPKYYNDLSFKYSSLSITTENDSRVLGSAENEPYDKFNSTQLDLKDK